MENTNLLPELSCVLHSVTALRALMQRYHQLLPCDYGMLDAFGGKVSTKCHSLWSGNERIYYRN